MDLVAWRLALHEMHLDLEVLACLAEGRVSGLGEDHLRLADSAFLVCLVACRKACHENRLCSTRGCDTGCVFGRIKKRQDLLCVSPESRVFE